ncbi:putative (+)-borneol dehydrogenase [Rosa chinensis]|uniref:Putative (+)-borneol dehydrogenase n=1 Tax=Rosa chinensis TaxID=74649 RepID=A0A2P6QE87_ROSCH|nr:putative (+)-borneol dehydrogenase [Rosa chinensis]
MRTTTNIGLEGKVAVITGGASGIGLSTARLFSRHGAKVVIADVQDDLGQSVCRYLNPSSTTFIHCNVTNEKDVENAVNTATAKYGKLDIMFNNAGFSDLAKPNILDNNKADFEQVLRVKLVGVFLGIKHATRVMMGARKGIIINTASVCSVIGGAASHAYTSSKHGVEGLKKNTAGVGGVYSNLKGAVLKAKDVAEAVLYLGSDESKYVSGHNLIVDGGYTIVNSRFCMFEQS